MEKFLPREIDAAWPNPELTSKFGNWKFGGSVDRFRRQFPWGENVMIEDRPQQSTGQPPRDNGTMKGRGTPGGLSRNFQIWDFLDLSSFWRNLTRIISAPVRPAKAGLFNSILRSKTITLKQPNIHFGGASYFANLWLEHSKQGSVLDG